MSKLPTIIFIVGPTAVGKSELALALAQEIRGEIISCDSMQVYREISIANNKPSQKNLTKIPHHLINIISVKEEFDVVRFNDLAIQAIKDIHKRQRVPIIVGGSGLYMQVLLDGIFKGTSKDEALRLRLLKEKPENLYQRLKDIDPKAALKIHANDTKRIVRALEVWEKEGQAISQLQSKRQGLWGNYDIFIFGLTRDREQLYGMINQRVEDMFKEGLVDEVKKISSLRLSQTAERIIGVREVEGYLKGKYDLNHAKELMKMNTRRYAKRQGTWFKKEKRIEWFDLTTEKEVHGTSTA